MKTNCVLLATILSFAVSANGQGFSFLFKISPYKVGVSVTNKAGTDKNLLEQEKVIAKVFTQAIAEFTNALSLSSTNEALKKALGPFQTPISLRTLEHLSLTVMMLDKAEALESPTTWSLPNLGDKEIAFVTKIPYVFLKKASTERHLEHVALHEIGHIVLGDLKQKNPDMTDLEEEHYVEVLVYYVAGKAKYTEYHKLWIVAQEPNVTPTSLQVQSDQWMKWLNIGGETNGSLIFR